MLKLIITISVILISALAPPAWAQSWSDEGLSGKVSQPDYSHLEYFGFYASAMGPWNFTGELAPWTNLTWIHVGSWDFPEAAIDDFMERMQQAQDAGVQATLSIESLLFTSRAGELRDEEERVIATVHEDDRDERADQFFPAAFRPVPEPANRQPENASQ